MYLVYQIAKRDTAYLTRFCCRRVPPVLVPRYIRLSTVGNRTVPVTRVWNELSQPRRVCSRPRTHPFGRSFLDFL